MSSIERDEDEQPLLFHQAINIRLKLLEILRVGVLLIPERRVAALVGVPREVALLRLINRFFRIDLDHSKVIRHVL